MPEIEDLLLPHISRLKTYQGVSPSETLAEEAGIPLEQVIRLNGNENPYGPSPQVAEALGSFTDYNLYPDPAQMRLREALSRYLGVHEDNIVAGNGSDEIIDLLMRMFLAPGDEIIIPVPTFGMYSFSADVAGAHAVSVPRDENFDIDIEAIKGAINPRTKAIFFPSPNNPTGNLVTESQARALLDTGPTRSRGRSVLRFLWANAYALAVGIPKPRGVAYLQQMGRPRWPAHRSGRHGR